MKQSRKRLQRSDKLTAKEDARLLLKAARQSVEEALSGKDTEPSTALKEKFPEHKGLFVTIHKKGDLRGCIGYVEGIMPLSEAVIKLSRSAAFEDPRFPPVTEDEIPELAFEISILSIPEQIEAKTEQEYLDNIEVGRDGLIVKTGIRSGLLLPQVAPEWGWDAREFLEHTCQKAGLPHDAWKDDSVEVYKFYAEVFSE